jgi:hypothetical protein
LAGELIQVIGDGRMNDRASVRIIMRNTAHEYKCCECEGPASWVNQYELELFYCEEHKPEDDVGISGVANSPRMGVCGYEENKEFDTRVPPVAHAHHAITKKRKISDQSAKPSKKSSS